MQAQGQRTAILSSLPLQILIYFNGWYCVAYFLIEALLFIYKDHHFYYPPDIMAWEASMLSMLAIMEVVRLFLASNLIRRVPEAWAPLRKSLKVIFLGGNERVSLPDWIGEVPLHG